MLPDEIQVELRGPHGRIDPRAVAEAITALDKILRSLSAEQDVPITLSALSVGSANIGIRSSAHNASTLRTGLRELEKLAELPQGWSVDTITGFLELDQVRRRAGVEQIGLRIDDALQLIDRRLTENAKAIVAAPAPSLGSVRGELYRYNGQRRTAALRDYRNAKVVTVRFPPPLADAVRNALDREVEVQGVVARDQHDQPQSIELTELEIIGPAEKKTTLDDVIGLYGPEWTGGVDSVEWIRRQRG